MSYWDEINEKIVELYTLLKWGMISKDELKEYKLQIIGRV